MKRSPTRQAFAGLAAVALLGAACGPADEAADDAVTTDGATAQAEGQEVDVRIKDFVFMPAEISVPVGSTVNWTNEDFFGHTVTSGEPGAQTDTFDGVLGEVAQAEGMGFSFTFDEPGTYDYYCRFHPRMLGTVTVTG